MRYKVGDKVVIACSEGSSMWYPDAKEQIGKIRTIKSIDRDAYFLKECVFCWLDIDIDHEATAKLTLPQPSKDMLRSGMKVVYRNRNERFVLVETKSLHDRTGYCQILLSKFDDYLKLCDEPNADDDFDIMQIWDGDTLIAQRTEKSEAELKKESLEKQMADLQQKVDEIAKEIKGL